MLLLFEGLPLLVLLQPIQFGCIASCHHVDISLTPSDLPAPVNGESAAQKGDGIMENKDREDDWTSGNIKRGASPEDTHNE